MKITGYRIALAVLLAALAGCLGAFATDRWFGSHQSVGLHDFVHDELDLTSQQTSQLDSLEERFAIENAQLELSVRRSNAGLAAAIDNEQQYGPEVGAAIDQVHQSMGELQKGTIRHVFAMREILNEDQRRQFDRQVSRSLTGQPKD